MGVQNFEFSEYILISFQLYFLLIREIDSLQNASKVFKKETLYTFTSTSALFIAHYFIMILGTS